MAETISILGTTDSYLNQLLFELREESIQADRMRFRANLERIGFLLGYEISKELSYSSQTVTTPLGRLDMRLPENQPVILSILRAGLPLHNGFLQLYDKADNGFISAYRHHTSGNEFVVKIEYLAAPELEGRTLMLLDPMIATGKSMVLSYRSVIEQLGQPEQIFVAGVLASEEGLAYVHRNMPKARIFVGAVDKELTAKAYIVPGLGDAGDLAFGPK
ncbi:MAG: uracil phosphoribosyltransferase [Bacteroidota bacterium]